ncbi:MAG: carboxypeptidase regulatory-like domain-containing protein, partial [Theionarchaea archaeon]|nr:carboxypeptidase regulatory-like domain-containing protein [Theionarchaea archaeon]
MANTKSRKISSLLTCLLLVGGMFILNSRQVAAQSIGGTVYEDTNMNGVLDAGESSVTGGTVFLDYPAGASMAIGGGGAYNFGTSMGFHCVTVRVPGYKTLTKNVNVTGAMVVNLGLVPFESITGRAVKTDGTGVVGMHVEVYDQTMTFIQETFTDVFGNYCVHGLPPGMYNLRIMKAEYFDQWKFNITVDGMTIAGVSYNWHTTQNVNFTNLSYDHGMIFGVVATGVGGLPGAVVEVPGLGLSTTTDALGNYAIHNIPAGYYYVIAKKNGFQTGVEFVCVANGSAGPTGPINFTLSAATGLPIIEGRVSDSMQAIENALV